MLAGEVGGRWSEETQAFLRQLAKARARSEAVPQQARAWAAWQMRWRAILACSSCQSVRNVSAGSEDRWRVRWSHSDHCRRCRGVPPRRGRVSGSLFLLCWCLKKKQSSRLRLSCCHKQLITSASGRLFPQSLSEHTQKVCLVCFPRRRPKRR